MKTRIIKPLNKSDLKKPAKFLRKGKLVAFPTETVYGLGANALDVDAVKKIFIAKGRPADNPLIVHIADKNDLKKLVRKIPEKAKILIEKFWPGPLTIVFEKKEIVSNIVTARQKTVAVRMPKNKIALDLIKMARVPIAAPSANTSTRPSPTKAEHVFDDLNGKIDIIVDGGKTDVGLESTVIDLTSKIPTILRPGKITKEEIEKLIGKVFAKTKSGKNVKSPGMKYKHYSPKAKVILASKKEIKKISKKFKDKKIGIIFCGNSLEEYAKNIFSEFREMDKMGIEVILAEKVEEKGIGVAIMNRLKKAAGGK